MAKHDQPPLISYPQRACSGGEFRGQFTLTPQLFSYKYNGWLAVIHIPTGTVFNRHGQILSIGNEFTEAVDDLSQSPFDWLVCEALSRRHKIAKRSLFIIDWINPELTMIKRHQSLRDWFPLHEYKVLPAEDRAYLIEQFEDSNEGLYGRWNDMQAMNNRLTADIVKEPTEFYEGFVATDKYSKYQMQLQSPNKTTTRIQKYRFC